MALLWIDGFDKYGTVTATLCDPIDVLKTRYTQKGDRVYIYVGRDADYSIVMAWDATDWIQTPHLTTNSTIIVGFSMYTPNTHGSGEVFQLRSPDNHHSDVIGGLSIHLNADASLTLKRDVTTIGSTLASVVPVDDWCTLELKIFCDNAAGTYELRVNDVDELSGTGTDTQSDGDSYYSVVRFNGALGVVPANNVRIDDFWVCDGAGGEWTDFLGSGARVGTISPMADAYPNQWDEQPVGNHYEAVDEDTQNDAEYIESDTANQTELFEYQTPPTTNTIFGVQVVTEMITTEPNVWTIKTVIKHGATEDEDAGQVVGTSDWTSIRRLIEKNPVTSNLWTQSDVDGIQAGVKVG